MEGNIIVSTNTLCYLYMILVYFRTPTLQYRLYTFKETSKDNITGKCFGNTINGFIWDVHLSFTTSDKFLFKFPNGILSKTECIGNFKMLLYWVARKVSDMTRRRRENIFLIFYWYACCHEHINCKVHYVVYSKFLPSVFFIKNFVFIKFSSNFTFIAFICQKNHWTKIWNARLVAYFLLT